VAGTPLPLFSHATSIRAPDLNEFSYAVSADGQRFLVLSRPDVEEGIHVPTNWTQQDVNDHRASCSPKLDFMTLALGKVDSSAVLAAFLIFWVTTLEAPKRYNDGIVYDYVICLALAVFLGVWIALWDEDSWRRRRHASSRAPLPTPAPTGAG